MELSLIGDSQQTIMVNWKNSLVILRVVNNSCKYCNERFHSLLCNSGGKFNLSHLQAVTVNASYIVTIGSFQVLTNWIKVTIGWSKRTINLVYDFVQRLKMVWQTGSKHVFIVPYFRCCWRIECIFHSLCFGAQSDENKLHYLQRMDWLSCFIEVDHRRCTSIKWTNIVNPTPNRNCTTYLGKW